MRFFLFVFYMLEYEMVGVRKAGLSGSDTAELGFSLTTISLVSRN